MQRTSETNYPATYSDIVLRGSFNINKTSTHWYRILDCLCGWKSQDSFSAFAIARVLFRLVLYISKTLTQENWHKVWLFRRETANCIPKTWVWGSQICGSYQRIEFAHIFKGVLYHACRDFVINTFNIHSFESSKRTNDLNMTILSICSSVQILGIKIP
jgi:hypothetical protein